MKLSLSFALAVFSLAPAQDPTLADLIRKLGADDFTEQGRAAAALEQMGKAAVPHLQKIQKESGDARVRTWCGWILEKIEAQGARYKDLITKLGSPDDEVKEAAERELRRIGAPAIPHLQEQLKSEDKNLRRRADKLLKEIDSDGREARKEGAPRRGLPESSVLASLRWLARHQNADGSWSADGFSRQCVGAKCEGGGESDYDAGLTGLAILAFQGAGYSNLSKDEVVDPAADGRVHKFGEVVKNGLKWLLSKQDGAGCIGGRGTKYMYNHAVATWALVEAYGNTGTGLFKGPAQQAVDFLVESQNPGKGWRYTKQSGDNDTSVTGWAVLALKGAETAELLVPNSAYQGALDWFDEVTDPTIFYRSGYNSKHSGKVFVPGKNETFTHHETMTAIATACRLFISRDRADAKVGGVALLVKDLPEWKENEVDFYYWHHATLALFLYDGPEGKYWKKWSVPLIRALVPNQKSDRDGCSSGSWSPAEDRWGFEGGRVYAVALNALTLVTAYRTDPVLVAPGK